MFLPIDSTTANGTFVVSFDFFSPASRRLALDLLSDTVNAQLLLVVQDIFLTIITELQISLSFTYLDNLESRL